MFTCINYHIPCLISVCLCVVETLQVLVNDSLGGAVQDGVCAAGPVTLPRRAETFGGFDSHQMNISKSKGGCVFHVGVCVRVFCNATRVCRCLFQVRLIVFDLLQMETERRLKTPQSSAGLSQTAF